MEFANVILLNKADLASEDDMATLEALVRRLNPAARVTRTVSSDVGLDAVLGTGEFDFEEASQAAGWVQVRRKFGEVYVLVPIVACCKGFIVVVLIAVVVLGVVVIVEVR